MLHYHIRWSEKIVSNWKCFSALDWEAFTSRAEAEASARQLVRQNETYTIEEHDGNCPRCQDAAK
jgi:hypothetical protein